MALPFNDKVSKDGQVHDPERIEYFREHLHAVYRALRQKSASEKAISRGLFWTISLNGLMVIQNGLDWCMSNYKTQKSASLRIVDIGTVVFRESNT